MNRLCQCVVIPAVMLALLPGARAHADRTPQDEIKAKIKAAGDAEKHDGAAYVIVLDESDCMVRPSGERLLRLSGQTDGKSLPNLEPIEKPLRLVAGASDPTAPDQADEKP